MRQGGGAACFECDYNTDCETGNPDLAQCWPIREGGGGYCRCYDARACAPGQLCRITLATEDNYCYYP